MAQWHVAVMKMSRHRNGGLQYQRGLIISVWRRHQRGSKYSYGVSYPSAAYLIWRKWLSSALSENKYGVPVAWHVAASGCQLSASWLMVSENILAAGISAWLIA
jgi:hypothetical protein